MATPRIKVSVTLPADLVAHVDSVARRTGHTRSGVFEDWLRAGASRAAERSIDDATAAYYASLRGEARAEEEAIARATTAGARRIARTYDAKARRASRRAKTR